MVAPKIDLKIRRAEQTDAPTLYQVVNEAYRKTGGWTGEHDLVEGDRISEEDLRRQIGHQEHEEGRIVILVAEDEKGEVVGCCAVKPWKDSKEEVEIGMLSVAIKAQSGGVGTQMIRSAFDTCVSAFNATHAVVQVLSVRDDIISWYKRLGFMQVGEPFPTYDWMKIRVENCNFVVLKKDLVEKYFHLILLLKF